MFNEGDLVFFEYNDNCMIGNYKEFHNDYHVIIVNEKEYITKGSVTKVYV